MTTCRVLYLSDPPVRTRICRVFSPVGTHLPDQSVTNNVTSQFEFFAKNIQGIKLWLSNRYFPKTGFSGFPVTS